MLITGGMEESPLSRRCNRRECSKPTCHEQKSPSLRDHSDGPKHVGPPVDTATVLCGGFPKLSMSSTARGEHSLRGWCTHLRYHLVLAHPEHIGARGRPSNLAQGIRIRREVPMPRYPSRILWRNFGNIVLLSRYPLASCGTACGFKSPEP